MKQMITIQRVQNREAYLNFFLMADEDEAIVRAYLEEGEAFSIHCGEEVMGACLMVFPNAQKAEIKNIAISEPFRGKGMGKTVIQLIADHYRKRSIENLYVGTANSSIENLAFYQKAGFRFDSIINGFFDHYPEPFYEHGIQGRDLIYFVMRL